MICFGQRPYLLFELVPREGSSPCPTGVRVWKQKSTPRLNPRPGGKNPLSYSRDPPSGPGTAPSHPGRPPAVFRRPRPGRPPAARRAETRRRSASAPDGAGPKFGAAPAGAPRGPRATLRDVAEVPHRTGRPRAPAKRGALVRLGRQPGPGLGPRGEVSGPDRAGAGGEGARRPDTTGAEPSAEVYVAPAPPPPSSGNACGWALLAASLKHDVDAPVQR